MSDDDARYQQRVDSEHERSYSAAKASGVPCALIRFPALRELLEAVEAKSQRVVRMGTSFYYRGRSFPLLHSSFGRVIVQHPATRRNIGSTGFFSRW